MTTRTFSPYERDDLWLLPPSPRDWLPEAHRAYFLSDLVDELTLTPILQTYGGVTRGTAPYHPRMLVKVLFSAHAGGDSGVAADCPEIGRGRGFSGLGGQSAAGFPHDHGLQPHRIETFKLSTDKRFVEKLTDVVGVYLNPPDKAVVLCVDEQS